jgi:hypothetical protein
MCVAAQEFNDDESEVLGLIQRIQDLVLSDSDGRSACNPALNFEEAKPPGLSIAAFDVIAKISIDELLVRPESAWVTKDLEQKVLAHAIGTVVPDTFMKCASAA